ncbi:MAG: hypothetical protein HW380_2510 [Magnetococcales bacterium]|nr:hypothetical protein [Magnetococcales bacterium]
MDTEGTVWIIGNSSHRFFHRRAVHEQGGGSKVSLVHQSKYFFVDFLGDSKIIGINHAGYGIDGRKGHGGVFNVKVYSSPIQVPGKWWGNRNLSKDFGQDTPSSLKKGSCS